MKHLLMSTLFAVIISCNVSAQEIVSSTYLDSYSLSYFTDELEVPFSQYGVDLYRVLYSTTDLYGDPDTASALLVIPDVEQGQLPLLSYSHGTAGSRFDVPGYLSFEHNLPAVYASMGTVAVAADYLGLGYSEGIHPYVHADTEASTSLDLITAIKAYLPDNEGVVLNDQLFLTGYSQGGHAAMALHRLIETETDLTVTGAVPMSGPYSISEGMLTLLSSSAEYTQVVYLAATAISYQEAYGNIYPAGDIFQFFKQPYADIIVRFKNEDISLLEANEELIAALIANAGGAFPKAMIFDDIVAEVLQEDMHPINIALRANDVYDWSPVADTRLIYCQADDQVSYLNSLIARDTMIANGATQVLAFDINSNFNHTECVTPAATNFVFYLLAFASITSTDDAPIAQFAVYPNPSDGQISLLLDPAISVVDIEIWDMNGALIQRLSQHPAQSKIFIAGYSGLHLMRVSNSSTGQSLGMQRIVVK